MCGAWRVPATGRVRYRRAVLAHDSFVFFLTEGCTLAFPLFFLASALSSSWVVVPRAATYFPKKGSQASLLQRASVGQQPPLVGSGDLVAQTDHVVYEGHLVATAASGLLALAMGRPLHDGDGNVHAPWHGGSAGRRRLA